MTSFFDVKQMFTLIWSIHAQPNDLYQFSSTPFWNLLVVKWPLWQQKFWFRRLWQNKRDLLIPLYQLGYSSLEQQMLEELFSIIVSQSVLIFIVLHSWKKDTLGPFFKLTDRFGSLRDTSQTNQRLKKWWVMFRVPPDLSCYVPEEFRTKHNYFCLVGDKKGKLTSRFYVYKRSLTSKQV